MYAAAGRGSSYEFGISSGSPSCLQCTILVYYVALMSNLTFFLGMVSHGCVTVVQSVECIFSIDGPRRG